MLGTPIRNIVFAGLFVISAQFAVSQAVPGQPNPAAGASHSAAVGGISQSPEQPSKVTLDYNETLFSVFTALNACGYDTDLDDSAPVRTEVRNEVSRRISASEKALAAEREVCNFYHDHQQPDAARNIAQYVSLALNLDDPPKFQTKLKEADMPPDASYVLGFVPLLTKFYEAADLNSIWLKHQRDYAAIIAQLQEPVANTLLATEVYLKIPLSGYLGRQFVIYVEPMASPSEVNARNYGADYFMVVSPEHGRINLAQVRHTYLHFILDPMALKRATALKYISKLLKDVQTAPMDDSYKTDISLLLTESLIRAIEAHMIPGKTAEPEREKLVDESMKSGFILTRYFYDRLTQFSKDATGLTEAYPEWLFDIDVNKEHKRATDIVFAEKAAPEVLSTTTSQRKDPLDLAERKLGEGDVAGAQRLAQAVLDQKGPNPDRALFILGQVASLNRDVDGAVNYFEQTIKTSKTPRLVAWSHIYLGRIYDMQDERDTAVQQYEAALQAGDESTKAAAERGLKQPFHAPKQGTKQEQ